MRTEGKHNNGYPRKNIPAKMIRPGLPRDLKAVWPEVFSYRTLISRPSDSGIVLFNDVKNDVPVYKADPILEIGAAENVLVDHLQAKGYKNAVGIDMDPVILQSTHGRHINFRDLPAKEKYKLILFVNILDYFEGGGFDHFNAPSMDIFALKLALHLKPKGCIAFLEASQNQDIFKTEIKKLDFEEIRPYLWEKA
jgi:hypothetical protein